MGIMWGTYIVTKGMNFKGTSNNGAVRGIHLTRTPGDDPRSNGRAETAVKSIKTQIRRILLQAGAELSKVVALGNTLCQRAESSCQT